MPNAAQKTAATKKAAAKKTAANPPQSFLYRLPTGWEYQVTIVGPDGTSVFLANDESGDALAFVVTTPDGNVRESTVADMPAGLKQASTAVKSLDKVAQREAALAEARDEALGFLDAPPAPGTVKNTKKTTAKTTAKKTTAKKTASGSTAKKAAATLDPAPEPEGKANVLDDVD